MIQTRKDNMSKSKPVKTLALPIKTGCEFDMRLMDGIELIKLHISSGKTTDALRYAVNDTAKRLRRRRA